MFFKIEEGKLVRDTEKENEIKPENLEENFKAYKEEKEKEIKELIKENEKLTRMLERYKNGK